MAGLYIVLQCTSDFGHWYIADSVWRMKMFHFVYFALILNTVLVCQPQTVDELNLELRKVDLAEEKLLKRGIYDFSTTSKDNFHYEPGDELMRSQLYEQKGQNNKGHSCYVSKMWGYRKAGGSPVLVADEIVVENPGYYAWIAEKDGVYSVTRMFEKENNDTSSFSTIMSAGSIADLLSKPSAKTSIEVQSEGVVVKVDYDLDSDWNVLKMTHAVCVFKYSDQNRIWHPMEVVCHYGQDNPNHFKTKSARFEWNNFNGFPVLESKNEEIVYLARRKDKMMRKTTEWKREIKGSAVTLPKSKCFVSNFGLPEPPISQKNSPTILRTVLLLFLLLFLSVVTVVFLKRKS